MFFGLFDWQFSSYNELVIFSMSFSVFCLACLAAWWSVFTPGSRDNPTKTARFLGWFCEEYGDAFFVGCLFLFFVVFLNGWEAYGKLLIIFYVIIVVPIFIHGARRITRKQKEAENVHDCPSNS